MQLNELATGQESVLTGFKGQALAQQARYLSLGIIPGSNVKVVRVAPLGCPWQIKVGSTLLSIRKSEAEDILVGFSS